MKTGTAAIDFGLYLVTDRGLSGGRPLEKIVRESVAGGVTVVQLREKDAGTREFLRQALALRQTASRLGIPFIINDRVDVALACRADGVHLGQEDMPCALARGIVGKHMTIGVSVSTVDEAVEAEADGADYLGVGPLFATATKVDTVPATGLGILQAIRRAVRIPLVGIGGLNAANAGDVIRAGADGVAVVSAIIASPDPEAAARAIRSAIDEVIRIRIQDDHKAARRRRRRRTW
jgi:thiamine-phosphate pyrophosphorylase